MTSSATNKTVSASSDTAGAFTPGPWQQLSSVAEGGDPSDTWFIKAQPHPAMRGFTKDIAMVEGQADARLIAAAPDLYEALKAAIECGMVPASSVKDGGAVRHSRQVRVADMIRAAIAKAEGR